jgi:adenosyl cobinamide kinase/adenosyl cobinamide phosphate guanylyltransferase
VDATNDLAGTLTRVRGTALVDSLGPWVARFGGGADLATARAAALCEVLAERDGDTVVVSDEVGLAVHPSSREGRCFRDALGLLNHAVAAVADKAYLVVAGRALELPPPGPPA